MRIVNYTFKGERELGEALRQVAFDNRTTQSSFIYDLVTSHPEIKRKLKELKKQQHGNKKESR